jgi:hypothetical protein
MFRKAVFVALTVLVCTAIVAAVDGHRRGLAPSGLDKESLLYQSCGLEKLSDSERANLFRMAQCLPVRSYLEESAMRFVENDQWEEAEIYGTQTLRFDIDIADRLYLIAYAGGKTLILEPGLTETNIPMPGLYWSKFEGSRLVILTKDGKKQDFWIKRTV